MSTFKAPSTALLRAFLKPSLPETCIRHASMTPGFMPRHKYAKPNRLDKLHRKQKQAIRQERQAGLDRAASMDLLPSASVLTPTTTPSTPSSFSTTSTAPLPFTIHRTIQRNLPIYETTKAGGSKHITQLRKLSGDLDSLASELRAVLGLPESYLDQKGRKKECVVVNRLTSQVVIRGWRGAEVKKWVESLGL